MALDAAQPLRTTSALLPQTPPSPSSSPLALSLAPHPTRPPPASGRPQNLGGRSQGAIWDGTRVWRGCRQCMSCALRNAFPPSIVPQCHLFRLPSQSPSSVFFLLVGPKHVMAYVIVCRYDGGVLADGSAAGDTAMSAGVTSAQDTVISAKRT